MLKCKLPYDFGQTVYIIGQVDLDIVTCTSCNGRGVYTENDDPYTGWRTYDCHTCKQSGKMAKTGKPNLEWQIVRQLDVSAYHVSQNGLWFITAYNTAVPVDENVFDSQRLARQACDGWNNVLKSVSKPKPVVNKFLETVNQASRKRR